MLTCQPTSIFSWNFHVTGSPAGPAVLEFDFFTEQGSITAGGQDYTVRKHGMLSGRWTLELGRQPIAEAFKPNPFTRLFEVQYDDLRFNLAAQSPFTRCYDLLAGGRRLGSIAPEHPFTRRSSINCNPDVPGLAQLFSFWLVVLTWRRAANNNN